MAMQTHFLDSEENPIQDTRGRSVITDYLGPLAVGTKLKLGKDEYQISHTVLTFNDADGSFKNSVVLRKMRSSFIASWTTDQQFHLVLAMAVLSVLCGSLIYWIYASAPLLWAALCWRFGVPTGIFVMGLAIGRRVQGSFFGRQPTFVGLYLSFVFLWGGMCLSLIWLVYFAPPSSIDLWKEPAAYVDYFHNEFDPIQSIAVAMLGWLSATLGFLGLEGLGKLIDLVPGKPKS